MATNITTTKVDVEALYRALIAGINANLPNVALFNLNDQQFARADLLGQFQARIDAAEAVKAAKTQWHTLVAAERALNRSVSRLRAAMRRYLEALYGADNQKLQDFGFTPAAAPKTKVAVKAEAQVKAKATRSARHTMGKRQKKDIKGTEPAPQPAPAPANTSPAEPAPAPATPVKS